MRTSFLHHRWFQVIGLIGLSCTVMPVHAQDGGSEQELMRIIESQQQQLEAQQEQLEAQTQLLREIQSQTQAQIEVSRRETQRLGDLVSQQQQQLESLRAQISGAGVTDEQVAAAVSDDVERRLDDAVTTPGSERVRLALSGHVNRMVSVIDDGEDTDLYFVDNDNSETQVRLVGTAQVNDDLTLGTTVEVSIAPNISGQVDQQSQENNNDFDQRKAEVTLESERYGKLWLGKGFTASYTVGAVDFSRTSVISYSTIVDTAGSMIFRDSETGEFTDLRIFNAFNSFDGLNRRNRIRYDTPKFGGFQLAATAISDSRYDAALRWGGRGYGFKAGGAVAIGNPNENDADLQYNGSYAMLHEDSGLNFALSFGILDREGMDDAQNYFAKVGWLKNIFGIGETGVSLDYTRSLNLPTDRDDGYSIGAAAVQQIDEFGAEVFALYRLHSLDRDVEPDVQDIDVFSLGTRIRF